jgi:hypothetical protein
MAGVGRSSPMSTSSTLPQAEAAGSSRWHGLWVPKVTVRSAVTWTPSTSPVSTQTPLGVSTATTGTPSSASRAASASGRSPGFPPIPTIPSMTKSPGSERSGPELVEVTPEETIPPAAFRAPTPPACARSDNSHASTRAPRRASSAPAYNASPPLSPLPTSRTIRRP